MALMKWREPNRARWVGIRPAHEGESVTKSGLIQNATAILHTVTAGKTFFLTDWAFSTYTTATNQIGELSVRNGADVFQYYIFYMTYGAIGGIAVASALFHPREIPAGWDIYINSAGASIRVFGSVNGWEE